MLPTGRLLVLLALYFLRLIVAAIILLVRASDWVSNFSRRAFVISHSGIVPFSTEQTVRCD